jgi:hypothetical protein
VVALATLLLPAIAHAYPWMIRHGYSACAMCHLDPSGGSVVTEYGRAQGDLLLRTPFGRKGGAEEEEASPTAGFLWGAVKTPDWLLLGGTFRSLLENTRSAGSPSTTRLIAMQSDLRAGISTSRIKAYASLGFQHEGGRPAALTHGTGDNAVSREHWIGISMGDESMLLRAGRMELPFGLRVIEHTLWVRQATRTDINDQQQHGLAFAYTSDTFRAEAMAILGNYQMRPDDYRERGYSAFAEYAVSPKAALGVTSLFTSAKRDVVELITRRRQAHGVFARVVPAKPLVVMLEMDLLLDSLVDEPIRSGSASMLQADWEVVQGVHLMATGEVLHEAQLGAGTSVGGWASFAWFFAPHLDFRVDAIQQSRASASGTTISATSLLAQFHAWL